VPVSSDAIRFGVFRLDLLRQQIWRAQEPVVLRRKAWEVLVYLAQRPGVLVSTGELLDAVWPNTAITPNTLTNVIGELRQALDDTARTPRVIATVHRRGYRFVGSIEPGGDPSIDRAQLGAHDEGALVGRDSHCKRLWDAWAQVGRGRRQCLFVSGEAGLGKTMLVEHFLGSIREGASTAAESAVPRIVRAQCIEQYGIREGYMPILQAIEEMATGTGTEADDVRSRLARYAPAWLAQMPSLLPADDIRALRTSLFGGGAERMLREGVMFWNMLAASGPTVLVIEDLHWADPATVDLVGALARSASPAPLLLLATLRPVDAIVRSHPISNLVRHLQRTRHATDLVLTPFAAAEVQTYLEGRLGPESTTPQLVERVERQAGGNPLFVSALVSHLLASGWLARDESGHSRFEVAADIDLGLPDELRALIEAQIEALPPRSQELLDAASVAGDEFTAGTVAAGSGLTLEEVEDGLHEIAVQHRLVIVARDREPTEHERERYRFRHTLYRRGVLERITPARRRQLHRRIGLFCEQNSGPHLHAVASLLLAHFEACDDVPRRVRYHALAGESAALRFAYEDATAHFAAALALVSRLPGNPERAVQHAQLELGLGNTLALAHGMLDERVDAAFKRAEALALGAGAPRERFRALLGLIGVRLEQGMTVELGELVEELHHLRPSLPSLAAQVHWRAGELHMVCGDLVRARHEFELSQEADGEPGIPVIIDFRMVVAIDLSTIYANLGLLERAAALRAQTLAHCATLNAPFNQCLVSWLASMALAGQRDWRGATALAAECVALAKRFALHDFVGIDDWWVVCERSGMDSRELLTRAVADLRRGQGSLNLPFFAARLAESVLAEGDFDAADAAVDRGLHCAASLGLRFHEADLWRLKGSVLAQRLATRPSAGRTRPRSVDDDGSVTEAEGYFRRAVAVADHQSSVLFGLRAAADLAQFLAKHGRRSEAREDLVARCAAFSEECTAIDVQQARAVLATL